MRIVGGTWGGRIISAPNGRETRPTSERAREAIFSILQRDVPGAFVLDLFAGSGALGFEALSRGARGAVLVDSGREAGRCIRQNIAALSAGDARFLPMDVFEALRHLTERSDLFDLVFMDPPYAADLHEKVLRSLPHIFAEGARVILEASTRIPLTLPTGYQVRTDRRYGDTRITVLSWEESL